MTEQKLLAVVSRETFIIFITPWEAKTSKYNEISWSNYAAGKLTCTYFLSSIKSNLTTETYQERIFKVRGEGISC